MSAKPSFAVLTRSIATFSAFQAVAYAQAEQHATVREKRPRTDSGLQQQRTVLDWYLEVG